MEYRLSGRRRRVVIPAIVAAVAMVVTAAALVPRDAPDTVALLGSVPDPTTTSVPLETAPPTTTAPTTTARPTTTRAPTTTAAPTTSTIPPTTVEPVQGATVTLPEQPPAPIAPPRDPRGAENLIQLGGISIPKLGVNAPLLEGIRLTTLDNGPGHWPGTALPGQNGNVVVAAHRTSHGGPFRHIDTLVAGDIVDFTTDGVVHRYVVTSTQVVYPDALWIVDQTPTPTATLFACHPPGSVAQRIVVHLELAS